MTETRSRRFPAAVAASALLASTLVFGLLGCSASGTASSTASTAASAPSKKAQSSGKVGPCVLTPAEAGAAINQPITSADPDADECRYSGGGNFFSVNVFPNSTESDWRNHLKVLSIVNKATPVSGVGDEADGSGAVFDVKSGSYILNVIGVDDDDTTTWPESVALAKAIIAKLS